MFKVTVTVGYARTRPAVDTARRNGASFATPQFSTRISLVTNFERDVFTFKAAISL